MTELENSLVLSGALKAPFSQQLTVKWRLVRVKRWQRAHTARRSEEERHCTDVGQSNRLWLCPAACWSRADSWKQNKTKQHPAHLSTSWTLSFFFKYDYMSTSMCGTLSKCSAAFWWCLFWTISPDGEIYLSSLCPLCRLIMAAQCH